MNNWFTAEKIDCETYAISEYGHWEQVHSYLLIGKEQALLIDTGLGIGNIKSVTKMLTGLPVKVITTHAHWDHIGGHHLFQDISIHKADEDWLKNGLPIPISVIRHNVMKEPFMRRLPEDFDIEDYSVYQGEPTNIITDGDVVDIGQRRVKVIHTPGHSPGHICLFEEEKGYLFTGDLIYKGTLDAFYPSTNPLQFMHSVDKISKLSAITKVLPAHYSLDIRPDFIRYVKEGFLRLFEKDLLVQGSGIFDFGEYQIHI